MHDGDRFFDYDCCGRSNGGHVTDRRMLWVGAPALYTEASKVAVRGRLKGLKLERN